jgi:hypothetical protein
MKIWWLRDDIQDPMIQKKNIKKKRWANVVLERNKKEKKKKKEYGIY